MSPDGTLPPRLILAGRCNCPDAAASSQSGRELLSELATLQGFDCPLHAWSPRGSGPPRHPALPAEYTPVLSHRRGMVVAGLANRPLGLDLEVPVARHLQRLDALIEMLPEPEVRQRIHAAEDRLSAFYRAWTSYEALFKLAWLQGQQPSHVLAMRLTNLAPEGDIHAWSAQTKAATLSLCGPYADLDIRWSQSSEVVMELSNRKA
ncbi:hypothetical protein BJB45_00650 [Halomonas huangheensis]|uniref:4'-phosphopantetheinyl transferase domain-containing protein n=2 Tax=Halomonas huangheensis TaxID=1178482 RepID=W1N3X1_9GAMM|nr:hypothetical protein BJB45_00650 [Halomonas huangheensis]